MLSPDKRLVVDRSLVEVPTGFELSPYAENLTGPVAMSFDDDGNLIVAEGAIEGGEPRIYGFTPALKRFDIYPLDKPVLPFSSRNFRLYGPIGGIRYYNGWLYVSHRDENDFGVITAIDYKGGHRTIVAGLPARGEYGVTDIAIDRRPQGSGRLYFGIGSATNSGVVGLDDFALGWVKQHPDVHDVPYTAGKDLILLGRRFNSPNPFAMFLAPDIAVSAPFQPFGSSSKTRIKGATEDNPKCNSAILSCEPDGGDLRVETHGVRLPRGLGFNEFGLYFTNQGMEARGTRPVNNDPDSFCRSYRNNWHGFPDNSTTLESITGQKYQPPSELLRGSGYEDLAPVINEKASELPALPNPRDVVYGVFPSQSGASGFEFAPNSGPFREFAGSAIVALFGDRAPFATSGQKLNGPVGFKIVRVEVDKALVRDFVKNVQPGPASQHSGDTRNQLERPIDVKFGPDGAMYILDYGKARIKDGRVSVEARSGKIYRLMPTRGPAGANVP